MPRSRQEIISDMVDSGLFSDDEIRQAANKQSQGPSSFSDKAMAWADANSMPLPPDAGFLNRKTKYLTIPQKLSQQGLSQLAAMVPSPEPQGKPGFLETAVRSAFPTATSFVQPGVIQDVAQGAPRVLADTMAEAAPGFVSRGAILGAGASKVAQGLAPIVKGTLRAIGNQGEELSGIAPRTSGALEAVYKDPSILSASKSDAGPLYEAGKAEMDQGNNLFRGQYKSEKIFDAAKSYLDKGGKLEPAEALLARKAVDDLISRSAAPDELYRYRDAFAEMTSPSKNISAADVAYQRGRFGDVLSKWAPQNKYGGASAFKMGIATALKAMGLPEPAIGVALSPRLQGLAAAGAGMAARQIVSPLANSPSMAAALSAALQRRRQDQ